MNEYVFDPDNLGSFKGISQSLKRIFDTPYPVILCVGSDLAVGDSLGPYIGSLLQRRLNNNLYIYGTLNSPITAKEVDAVFNNIKVIHPKSKILVIDASVGNKEDIGLIKISDKGIKPGLGVNKNLRELGDVSIIGIVAEKNSSLNKILYSTRFSLVYKLSEVIVLGILDYLNY